MPAMMVWPDSFVGFDAERRVFLGKTLESNAHFFLIGLGLGFDCLGDHGLREHHALEGHDRTRVAKGLASGDFLEPHAAQKAKWVNGKFGFIQSTWGRLIPTGDHYDPLKAVNDKAVIAQANAPKGPNGKFGYINFGPVTSSITFSKKLTGDRLTRALELVEGITADQAFATLVRYGKEGEHWQRDPQTNAIIPTTAFAKTESKGPLGINFFAAIPPTPDIQAFLARKDEAQLHAKAEAGMSRTSPPSPRCSCPRR